MTFDPKWPSGHVTRDGRKARVICVDRKTTGPFPVIALVELVEGSEQVECYTLGGGYSDICEHYLDLQNAPEPKQPVSSLDKALLAGAVQLAVNSTESRDSKDAYRAALGRVLSALGDKK